MLGFITQLVALYRPRKINKETKISGEFSFCCSEESEGRSTVDSKYVRVLGNEEEEEQICSCRCG